jgi:hypothetical protein
MFYTDKNQHLVVGSTALSYAGVLFRDPKDVDFWYSDEPAMLGDGKQIPQNIIDAVPYAINHYAPFVRYATPDAVYTIKCSHLPWDIHWEKTANDIIHLKRLGCKIDEKLWWLLYEYWQTVHGDKSFLSLDKNKDDFFNDYVPKVYDHDFLHEIVALPNTPVYKEVLKDKEEVLIDKIKFFELPKEKQIQMFKEEIYVIAIERYLLTNGIQYGRHKAYKEAVKKTITNLTKNWASLFIADNLEKFLRNTDKTWYNNFLNLTEGKEIMPPYIQELKEYAEELGVSSNIIEEVLVFGYLSIKPYPT